ncbi:MAG TPA: ATP synthase subunit I [Burkholderiales bacterium]|nr:ATP synthase subunit I [Burkholderiales bacterium]
MLRALSKPIRVVFRWQIATTAALALAAGLLAGKQGAISAAAGGLVSIIAGLVSAYVASWSSAKSAGGVLAGALRAEAVKVGLAVLLVWLVLTLYAEAVVLAFLGSFVATMVVFSMAFFVREY